MTSKEKAKELVSEFGTLFISKKKAKDCAQICASEIIDGELERIANLSAEYGIDIPYKSNNIDYWFSVKIEIKKR